MASKKTIKILKTVIPLLLGLGLIWYMLATLTPAEQETLWNHIKNADPRFLILSCVFGALSHLSRAYRWKFMLNAMGYKTTFANRFMAVMVAYLANLGIPRSGEVLRAATLTTYEDIPLEKGFGSIISERIADFFMLLIVIGVTLVMNTSEFYSYFASKDINPFYTLAILAGLVILTLAFAKIIKRSKNAFIQKVSNFIKGLVDGMKSILTMKNKGAFIFHTIFIWVMYVLMFWVVKFTIPVISEADFSIILAAFVIGSFAISITNGGIGSYPWAIGALFIFFNFTREAGEAFGWLVWSTQTLLVLVLGGLSFVFLPILNRKNKMKSDS